MDETINEYFWLISAALSATGVGIWAIVILRKNVGVNTVTHEELLRFSAWAIFWVFVPTIILWFLQSSIGSPVDPKVEYWPEPQRSYAFALNITLLIFAGMWVFLANGDVYLAKFLGAVYPWLKGRTRIRVLVAVLIAPGLLGALSALFRA